VIYVKWMTSGMICAEGWAIMGRIAVSIKIQNSELFAEVHRK